MATILLYYLYTHIENPDLIAEWQKIVCTRLKLKGRIIVACEGINGTLVGTQENTEQYKKEMLAHPLFVTIDFKESNGSITDFPRLKVVVKEEIVKLGIHPSAITVDQTATHLTPQEAHAKIEQEPDLVLFDARNNYESRIGTFKNAVTPDISNFRDLPTFIDQNESLFKNKKVLMFCTGGVRCERASAYLKSKNYSAEVYQIKGGIHRYLEEYPDGYFRGKNFVFDGRMTMATNNDILSTCDKCSQPWDQYTQCLNTACNKQLIILCPSCINKLNNYCSTQCQTIATGTYNTNRNLVATSSACEL